MSSRKLISLLLLVFLFCFISGCWDRRELEETGFVLALGLDSAPEDKISVTLQIAVPANLAPVGGGGGDGLPVIVETIEGKTLDQALRLFHTFTDRRLSYSHNKIIVVGEELAERGIEKELDLFTRHREMRRNVLMMVAKGKAEEFLKIVPQQERNPAQYLENLARLSSLTGVAPKIILHNFVLDYGMPGVDPITPLLKQERTKPEENQEEGQQNQGEEAGSKEITKLNLAGTAIFKGSNKIGELNMTETQGLLFLRGQINQAVINIPDPENATEQISLALTSASRRVETKFHRGQVVFDISIIVEADLRQVEGRINYVTPKGLQILQNNLNKQVEKEIRLAINKCQKEYQVDSIGLGEKVRETMSYDQWAKYNWREKFPEAKINVQVKSYIRRVGMTFRPLNSH